MSTAIDQLIYALRDFTTDGVAASGLKEPDKAEVRAALDALGIELDAILAAQAGGLPSYETKALLDADTSRPDGTRAFVWGDPVAANNTFYLWDDAGGSWSEDSDFIALITGPAGTDGTMGPATGNEVDEGTDDTKSATPLALANSQVTMKVVTNDEWDIALTNHEFRIVAGVKDGVLFPVAETAGPQAGTPDVQPPVAEVLGALSYGQSLSMGGSDDDGEPLVSTVLEYDSKKFVQGTRTWAGAPASVAAAHASLVDLVENTNGTYGETPLSGACSMINQLVIGEDGRTLGNKGFFMLAAAPGRGGKSVADLSEGSEYFQNLLDDVEWGVVRAAALGKTYDAPIVFWTQGEANISAGTSRASWVAQSKQLLAQINEEAGATLIGRSAPMRMIGYQVASHTVFDETVPEIALGQLAWHKEDSAGYIIATPAYFLPYVATGVSAGVHLTPTGYRIMGAYYGLAYKRTVFDRQDWECLRPIAQLRQGANVILEFNSETQLEFDTVTVSDPGDYGFDAIDDNGDPLAISGIEIVGLNKLKFSFAADFPAGGFVRCGFNGTSGNEAGPTTGARCNLRDSLGDTIVFDPGGTNWPMHRWCVFFEEQIA